jgi:hypothetical protein
MLAKTARWKVVLSAQGAAELVERQLLIAGLKAVSWSRRRGELFVSVKLQALTAEQAEAMAVELLDQARVRALRSRQTRRNGHSPMGRGA